MKVELELEGSVEEVIGELHRFAAEASAGVVVPQLPQNPAAVPVVDGLAGTSVGPPAASAWSDVQAADFVATLSPAFRGVLFHVWRAGKEGVHRDRLCRETRLTPSALRSLLISMAHHHNRFERERGERLSRPVVPDHRLRRYFIDQQFAAAASAPAFEGKEELGEWAGRDTGSGRFRTMASRWQSA